MSKPKHTKHLSNEHTPSGPIPALPWALQEPGPPATFGTAPLTTKSDRESVPPGKSLLGAPELAPPKREARDHEHDPDRHETHKRHRYGAGGLPQAGLKSEYAKPKTAKKES